jgi:CRP/FNR family transcriptional regulator
MELIEQLRSTRLCSGLNDDELLQVADIVTTKYLRKGEILFFEGDRAEGFYLLLAGLVKIYKLAQSGKEQLLHRIAPGQIFAEAAVFAGGKFPANCEALENSRVAFVPSQRFIELLKANPQISLKIITAQAAFLREFTELIENLSLREVPARIAFYLLEQANRVNSDTVQLDLSKTELARKLGTIAETFSRGLRKLIDLEALAIDGKQIRIKNRQLLSEIAEGKKI